MHNTTLQELKEEYINTTVQFLSWVQCAKDGSPFDIYIYFMNGFPFDIFHNGISFGSISCKVHIQYNSLDASQASWRN